MQKQNGKSWGKIIDEKLGFYHDERTERTQLVGVRRNYYVAAILFPMLAMYQQFVNRQQGVFWVMLTAVILSVLFLSMRRYQLSGAEPTDERFEQLFSKSHRHAYFILLIALAGYMIFLAINPAGWSRIGGAIMGMYLWTPAILITIAPLLATHIRRQSYPARAWRIMLLSTFIGLLISAVIGFLAAKSYIP